MRKLNNKNKNTGRRFRLGKDVRLYFFQQFGIDFGLKLTFRGSGDGHLQKILGTYCSQTRGSQTRQKCIIKSISSIYLLYNIIITEKIDRIKYH